MKIAKGPIAILPRYIAGRVNPNNVPGPCISYKPGEPPKVVIKADLIKPGHCQFCGRSITGFGRLNKKKSCKICAERMHDARQLELGIVRRKRGSF